MSYQAQNQFSSTQPVSSNPYQVSARSQVTPLYKGLTSRSARSRTPLPAPERAISLRDTARSKFSKTASFPNDSRPPTLHMFTANSIPSNASSRANRKLAAPSLYSNSFSQPTVVYDPVLPSPVVIVHGFPRNGFNKSVQERKHRGISRNVLGGFYTS